LLSLGILTQAKTISCYQAIRDEVETENLIKKLAQLNKFVQVPLVLSDHEMTFEAHEEYAKERSSMWGVTTARENIDGATADITLIPAVAVSRSGNRIGFGRGYYDRWLSENPKTRKIALVFECQISDLIVTEKHDQIMDFIVTENEVIRCNN